MLFLFFSFFLFFLSFLSFFFLFFLNKIAGELHRHSSLGSTLVTHWTGSENYRSRIKSGQLPVLLIHTLLENSFPYLWIAGGCFHEHGRTEWPQLRVQSQCLKHLLLDPFTGALWLLHQDRDFSLNENLVRFCCVRQKGS